MSDPNTPQMPPPDAQRTQPWVRVLLFVSLALNLLVAGVVIGALADRPSGDRDRYSSSQKASNPRAPNRPRVIEELGLAPYARGLPEERQRALRKEILRNRQDIRAGHEGVRASVRGVVAMLRTSNPSLEEVEAALAAQANAVDALRETGVRLMAAQIHLMSDAERADFANKLEAALRKGRRLEDPSGAPSVRRGD